MISRLKMQLLNADGYRGIFEVQGTFPPRAVSLWKLNSAFPSVVLADL